MKIEKFINNQEEIHRLETEGKKGADNDDGKGGTTKEPGDGPVQLNPEKVNDGNGGKGLIAKNNTPGDGKGGTTKDSIDPRVGNIIRFAVNIDDHPGRLAKIIGIEPGDGGKTQPMMVLQFLDANGKTMPEEPRAYPIGEPSIWGPRRVLTNNEEKNNTTPPPSDTDSSSDSDSDSGSDSDSDSDSDNGLGPVAGGPGGATKAGAKKAGAKKAGTKGDKWVQVRADISRDPPHVLVTGKIGDDAADMMDFGLN